MIEWYRLGGGCKEPGIVGTELAASTVLSNRSCQVIYLFLFLEVRSWWGMA